MLTDTIKSTFLNAPKKLTGNRKRDFMAKVTEDYFDSSACKAETIMGWNRQSVQLGLHERRTGIVFVENYQARGRHKSEEILPNLEADNTISRKKRFAERSCVRALRLGSSEAIACFFSNP